MDGWMDGWGFWKNDGKKKTLGKNHLKGLYVFFY